MLLQKAIWSDQLGWAQRQVKNTQVEIIVPPVHRRKSGKWNCFIASVFLQQMSHPGPICRKPYPIFLLERTKPPFMRHKNGTVLNALERKWETYSEVFIYFVHLGLWSKNSFWSGLVWFSACRITTVTVGHFDAVKIDLAKMWQCPQKSL